MRVGDLVACTFHDHVESGHGANVIRFTVFGRVRKMTSRAIVIASWEYADRRKGLDGNTTAFTVVRSAIDQVQVLTAS